MIHHQQLIVEEMPHMQKEQFLMSMIKVFDRLMEIDQAMPLSRIQYFLIVAFIEEAWGKEASQRTMGFYIEQAASTLWKHADALSSIDSRVRKGARLITEEGEGHGGKMSKRTFRTTPKGRELIRDLMEDFKPFDSFEEETEWKKKFIKRTRLEL